MQVIVADRSVFVFAFVEQRVVPDASIPNPTMELLPALVALAPAYFVVRGTDGATRHMSLREVLALPVHVQPPSVGWKCGWCRASWSLATRICLKCFVVRDEMVFHEPRSLVRANLCAAMLNPAMRSHTLVLEAQCLPYAVCAVQRSAQHIHRLKKRRLTTHVVKNHAGAGASFDPEGDAEGRSTSPVTALSVVDTQRHAYSRETSSLVTPAP